MNLATRIRLARGLHWKRPFWLPTLRQVIDTIALAVGAAAMYAAVAAFAYATRAEAAEADVEQTTGALVELLNGGHVTNPEQTWAAKCESVVTVTQQGAK